MPRQEMVLEKLTQPPPAGGEEFARFALNACIESMATGESATLNLLLIVPPGPADPYLISYATFPDAIRAIPSASQVLARKIANGALQGGALWAVAIETAILRARSNGAEVVPVNEAYLRATLMWGGPEVIVYIQRLTDNVMDADPQGLIQAVGAPQRFIYAAVSPQDEAVQVFEDPNDPRLATMLAEHPDAIVGEMDVPQAAVFDDVEDA